MSEMVNTIHGPMPVDALEKRVVEQSDPSWDADVTATEYWLNGELVHRSVNLALKGREMGAHSAVFG